MKRERLAALEREKSKVWDEFCRWCEENPSGGTPKVDYEKELKRLTFWIDCMKGD